MLLQGTHRIGRMAMLLALADENESPVLSIPKGWKYCTGKVGSMNSQKVVAEWKQRLKATKLLKQTFTEKHMHFIMQLWKLCTE